MAASVSARSQPAGCQPDAGGRRAEPLVELIPGEPAGEGLDVEQAGRPLRGTRPGEDPVVRLRPPRPGPAARAEGTCPPGLLAQKIGGIAFSQLLHPALRVTAQPPALPALRGLARLALLGSHGRQRSGSAPGGTSGRYKSVPPETTPVGTALIVAAGHAGHTAAMASEAGPLTVDLSASESSGRADQRVPTGSMTTAGRP
jgi:hypothetical protein